MPRSKQVAAGYAADLTSRLRYGPIEQPRKAAMAHWTSDHQHLAGYNPADNPHRKEAAYSKAELERAKRHEEWQAAHPAADPFDNPHNYTGPGALTRPASDT